MNRNSQNLQMPKHRTEHFINGFHYLAFKDWNNAPIDMCELPTLNTTMATESVYEEQDLSLTHWKNNSPLYLFHIGCFNI